MSFLGYTKITTEVVQLSMAQESFLEKILELESKPKGKVIIANYLRGQKALTAFLRSGRIISG